MGDSLVFQTEGRFASLLNAINLAQIWSAALMIVGYNQWTGKSMVKASVTILAPYVIILAIVITVILV